MATHWGLLIKAELVGEPQRRLLPAVVAELPSTRRHRHDQVVDVANPVAAARATPGVLIVDLTPVRERRLIIGRPRPLTPRHARLDHGTEAQAATLVIAKSH